MNTTETPAPPLPPPKREHVNRARFIASMYGEEID
jgi:hypothetical protein